MSNRDIKKFLPKTFHSDEIKNFLDNTTQTLFDEKKSEIINYFIGRKPGGLYLPNNDPYQVEDRKLREDYQLETSLVEKNPQTTDVNSILFFDDLLNSLSSDNVITNDQSRIFNSDIFSFSPPIDVDMFLNYRDYYWYPEGISAVPLKADKKDIEGRLSFTGEIVEEKMPFTITNGNHIILNDKKEYIVSGVGRFIELTEFDLDKGMPERIDRLFTTSNLPMIDRFPKEYITMERNSKDKNPWSRNNSWYHKDAINVRVGNLNFQPDRSRQALRPIISFIKDIELYNYSNNHILFVDAISDNKPTKVVDEIDIKNGDIVANKMSNTILQMNNGKYVTYKKAKHGDKITVKNGRDDKANEYVWSDDDSKWNIVQTKIKATQPILFNLYDSNVTSRSNGLFDKMRYPDSNFNGCPIFSYKQDDEGLLDQELDMNLEYKSYRNSSDILFKNYMNDTYMYSDGQPIDTQYYFKRYIDASLPQNNVIRFAIGSDENNNIAPYVNNEYMSRIILMEDISYIFDFSDSSTTNTGWHGKYRPFYIYDKDDNEIISPTHGKSTTVKHSVSFNIPEGQESETYFYRILNTDIIGEILVVKNISETVSLENEWKLNSNYNSKLKQSKEVTSKTDNKLPLHYEPINDDFVVYLNGNELTLDYYSFENRNVIINRTVEQYDYIEVIYTTRKTIDSPHLDVIQEVPTNLSNNSYNNEIIDMSYDDVFNHFASIIRNQPYLEGTPLSSNNYRDTIKDLSQGNVLIQSSNPLYPLMYVNKNDKVNLIDAIETSRIFYTQYKNNIVIKTEEMLNTIDVNNLTIKDIFDDIIAKINAGKQPSDAFNRTYMFASYKKYINVFSDSEGILDRFIDLTINNNALYIYTINGLQCVDNDYTIVSDSNTEETKIIPMTFNIDDILDIRFYDELEPVYCPATPTKFGLNKSSLPHFEIDYTYQTPKLFLIGHDNSKSLAYTSIESYNNDIIDARDSLLLEFEKRIFNSIPSEFKKVDVDAFNDKNILPGKFRASYYNKDERRLIEYKFFSQWASINQIDFTTNKTFVEGDPFTYNYNNNVDNDGEILDGHWRGIFNYYYDTDRPHVEPWKMLGFDIKPQWWESEYGIDYGSKNNKLWNDLEEGIIRQGERANIDYFEYKSRKNNFRRDGLKDVIPVDSLGNLKDPISVGITSEPNLFDAKASWKFGDGGPVELAWRSISDFDFYKQIINYILSPAEYVVQSWDTEHTYNIKSNGGVFKPRNARIHTKNNQIVPGITEWIYDSLKISNYNIDRDLILPYENSYVQLSHKVGGYVDSSELKVFTESYNPNSETLSTLIPYEDVSVITHKSKEVDQFDYSGVVVERVSANRDYYNFIYGRIYNKDDIIFLEEDNTYYKNVRTSNYQIWNKDTTYLKNRVVQFNSKVYICTVDHKSSEHNTPDISSDWKLKGFTPSEWAVMFNEPKTKYTSFKIYGYDIDQSYFIVSDYDESNRKQTLNIKGPNSKLASTGEWVSSKKYNKGDIISYNSYYYEAIVTHTSASNFDSSFWTIINDVPYTNTYRQEYHVEGNGNYYSLDYGTTLTTIEEVVEFLAGYGRKLEQDGWIFDGYDVTTNVKKDWNYTIREFVLWALSYQNEGDAITLSPFSNKAKIKTKHGVISTLKDTNKGDYTILDYTAKPIDIYSTKVNRNNGIYTLYCDYPIYFLRLNNIEYEHAITFNNETIFGDVIYDPRFNIRKDRLRLRGVKSKDWNGKLYAPGFIISNDKLLPNFETSIKEIQSFGDMNDASTKDIFNKLKYHNIGYQTRDYLENIEMNDKSQINFYQGFIRQKGTSEAFQRLLRSDVLDTNENMRISEEWAFKEGEFGGTETNQYIELFLDKNDIQISPQPIFLKYNNKEYTEKSRNVYVNIDDSSKWITKPKHFTNNKEIWEEDYLENVKKFPTAGYASWNDSILKSYGFHQLTEIMRRTNSVLDNNLTAWIARDETKSYGWNMYTLQESNVFASEIFSLGVDNRNSATIKAFNVQERVPYIVDDGKGNIYNVLFFYIKDGYYIMLEFSNEYVILDTDAEAKNLKFYEWKPLRIKANRNVSMDINKRIDSFITANDINTYEGMKLYIDNATQLKNGHYPWQVYEYQSNNWSLIREEKKVLKTDKIKDALIYENNGSILSNLQINDPIKGYFPGSNIDMIDYITEYDPVNYNVEDENFSNWDQDKMGQLWLDISKLRYLEYENDDDESKTIFWGNLFPGSSVDVYEWTRSIVKPENYELGIPKDINEYIISKDYSVDTGIEQTYYYFWVKNTNIIPDNKNRIVSALDISNTIRYPENNGVPFVSIYSNYAIGISDINNNITLKDCIIQINYQVGENINKSHEQWTLIQESPYKKHIPNFIFDKMIDSLLGFDIDDNIIPDPLLPEVQKYGNSNKPRQSWFIDNTMAQEIFFTKLNQYLKNINIWDVDLNWEDYADNIKRTTNTYTMIDWYDESFNRDTLITHLVQSRNDMKLEFMNDKEIIKVLEKPGRQPSVKFGGWTNYRYLEDENTFEKVAQSKSSIQFNIEKIKTMSFEDTKELRKMLNVLFGHILVDEFGEITNSLLFSLVRYVLSEQHSNNWVFPTTYISVRQQLQSMIQKPSFQKDKEEQIKSYISEAKPYHTKLREYYKVYNPRQENIGLRVTDFDKPPYITYNKRILNLQEKNIDKLEGDDETTDYNLNYLHEDNVLVTIDGKYVFPGSYSIVDKIIRFSEPPRKSRNYVKNIIVQSDNIPHIDIINKWHDTWGYSEVDSNNLSDWKSKVNQKRTKIWFDRISFFSTYSLEELLVIQKNIAVADKPLEAFTEYSDDIYKPIHEIDRIIIRNFENELKEIVEKSFSKILSYEENTIKHNLKYEKIILINNQFIDRRYYTDNGSEINLMLHINEGDVIAIRPKSLFQSLMYKASVQRGLNIPEGNLFENIGFNHSTVYYNLDVDNKRKILLDTLSDDLYKNRIENETVNFSHDAGTDLKISNGEFINNDNDNYPEELTGLNVKDCLLFSFYNKLPPLVKKGFDTIDGKDIQNTIKINLKSNVKSYDVNITVPLEQIIVMLNGDRIVENYHYKLTKNKIEIIRDFENNDKLLIIDRYATFDPYSDRNMDRITNIQSGGYDGYILDHSRQDEMPMKKEYILYTIDGRVHYMHCNEENGELVSENISVDDKEIQLSNFNEEFERVNNVDGCIAAITGIRYNGNGDIINSETEFVYYRHYNSGKLSGIIRNIFNSNDLEFDDKYDEIKVYPVIVEDTLDAFLLENQYINGTQRNDYPKYGHIIY